MSFTFIECEEISGGDHIGRRIIVWSDTNEAILAAVANHLNEVLDSAITLGACLCDVPTDFKWVPLCRKVVDAEVVEVPNG